MTFSSRLPLLGAMLLGPTVHSELSVPALFSDHAVLQRTEKVPVWGTASGGERIKVRIADVSAEATADAEGKWTVVLDLRRVPRTPHELIIEGRKTLRISDVLVGEVWIGSGQSNMEWSMRLTPEVDKETALPANPDLRVFKVRKVALPEPAASLEGAWEVASPDTIPGFTASGYYFVKYLQQELKTPVGLIHSSWGGSPVEAWTSMDSLAAHPELGPRALQLKKHFVEFPRQRREFIERYAEWSARTGRQDTPKAEAETLLNTASGDESGWQPVNMPGLFSASGLPDSGAVWLKTKVTVPSGLSGLQQPVGLGKLSGFFRVYWDGHLIKEITPETGQEDDTTIFIDGHLIKGGDSTLAIRVFNPGKNTAMQGAPHFAWSVPLSGRWQAWVERELPPIQGEALSTMPDAPRIPMLDRNTASFLYNGMIAPLIPYAMRGVVWYQGESNGGRAWQYRTAFPLMISDWRARWGQGDFPFYFCQLANVRAKIKEPGASSGLPEIREAQSLALSLPNTGQAVLMDVGEQDDVHARNKKDVGDRLARIALSETYGKKREFSGPVYESMRIEAGKIRLGFSHVGGGLVARQLPESYAPRSTLPAMIALERNSPSSQLEGFAICGKDRRWTWAEAEIDGESVLVWSPRVPIPVAVRFAWAPNPTFNLYNKAGLPAAPFRTDDYPLTTVNNKY